MATALADRIVPRIPAVGVVLLLGTVIGAVAIGRGDAPVNTSAGTAAPLQSRLLRFDDLPDGSVAVTDATGGAAVATLAPGTGGFLRGAMRGLARDRHREGAGPAAPFRLAVWPGGAFTLEDTATGRVLDLRAFGTTNAGAFASLLITRKDAP